MEITIGILLTLGIIIEFFIILYVCLYILDKEDIEIFILVQLIGVAIFILAMILISNNAYDKGYNDAKQEQSQQQTEIINKGGE